MAREVITKEVPADDAAVTTPDGNRAVSHSIVSSAPANRNVIIAVGAAIVLFIIGLVLGYLLGHSTATSYGRGTMMNGRYRTFDRDNMPMYQNRATNSTSNTSTSTVQNQ